MSKKNQIEEKEFCERLQKALASLKGKSKADAVTIRELFALHNDRMPKEEHGTHCGACVGRVYTRMKSLAEQLKIIY